MKKKCLIIGSGLAGCVLAQSLADTFDVTVLEAGPMRGFTFPKLEFAGKELGEVKTCAKGKGGTTNLWHNGLIRLRAQDIRNPDFRAVLKDSERFMSAAAHLLYYKGGDFEKVQSNLCDRANSTARHFGEFADGVDCLIYPERYAPLQPPPNTTCVYGVESIKFLRTEKAISRVEWTSGQDQGACDTDIIIVSSGSFGTPAVLSEILATNGTPVPDVGIGLIDHPMGFVGKFRFPKSVAKHIEAFALTKSKGFDYRSMIRLRSDCGEYLGCAFFRPCVSMSNDLSIYKYKSRLGASTGKERLYNAFSPKLFHPDIISEIMQHVTGSPIPTRTYAVLFLGEQRRRENRVSKRTDGTTVVDWNINEEELAAYSSMVRKLATNLADISEVSNVTETLTEDWLWSGAHHSGTVSMGGSTTDLLNTDLRVRDLENVFVCDASVIQEHSYANTGLTIAQLALRLSDSLKRNYSQLTR